MGMTSALTLRELGHYDPAIPADMPFSTDWIEFISAMILLITYLVAAFLGLKWIYRVSNNAHASGAQPTIRPGWAIGWYFVPVANLWLPFRAMRETWQISTNPDAWRKEPAPVLLRWWWGFFIASNYAGWMTARMAFNADNVGDLGLLALAEVVTAPIDVILHLLFIRLVGRLSAKQAEALSALAADSSGETARSPAA